MYEIPERVVRDGGPKVLEYLKLGVGIVRDVCVAESSAVRHNVRTIRQFCAAPLIKRRTRTAQEVVVVPACQTKVARLCRYELSDALRCVTKRHLRSRTYGVHHPALARRQQPLRFRNRFVRHGLYGLPQQSCGFRWGLVSRRKNVLDRAEIHRVGLAVRGDERGLAVGYRELRSGFWAGRFGRIEHTSGRGSFKVHHILLAVPHERLARPQLFCGGGKGFAKSLFFGDLVADVHVLCRRGGLEVVNPVNSNPLVPSLFCGGSGFLRISDTHFARVEHNRVVVVLAGFSRLKQRTGHRLRFAQYAVDQRLVYGGVFAKPSLVELQSLVVPGHPSVNGAEDVVKRPVRYALKHAAIEAVLLHVGTQRHVVGV